MARKERFLSRHPARGAGALQRRLDCAGRFAVGVSLGLFAGSAGAYGGTEGGTPASPIDLLTPGDPSKRRCGPSARAGDPACGPAHGADPRHHLRGVGLQGGIPISLATATGGTALGTNAVASGVNATALGVSTTASGDNAIAAGAGSSATTYNGVAIGNTAQAQGTSAVAIGISATAAGASSAALGMNASAAGTAAIALGQSASAPAARGAALGQYATAGGDSGSVALGVNATASVTNGVALGFAANAAGLSASALGQGTQATADFATAVGRVARAQAENAVAVGAVAQAAGVGATAVGTLATASDAGATALGLQASAGAPNAVAVGTNAIADSQDAVAIGTSSRATGGKAVAIGSRNIATGNGALAIGDPNIATGDGAVAQGMDNTASGAGAVAVGNTNVVGDGPAGTGAQGAVGIGYRNTVVGQGSVAIGNASRAMAAGAVALGDTAVASNAAGMALGNRTVAAVDGSVALGDGSVADRLLLPASGNTPAGTGYVPYNTSDAMLRGAISVGSPASGSAVASYRQITHVADGTDPHDAATVRQLQGAIGSISTTSTQYFHANSTALDSLAVGADAIAVGPGTIVNSDNGIGMGNGATVQMTAPGGTAIGHAAQASQPDALALGTQASADGIQSLAMGTGARAAFSGSVALGAGAATTVGARTGYTGYAVGAPQTSAGEVSVGNAGTERQITHVAPGVVATDAVNISQLHQVARNTADSLGGGAAYDAATGAYTAPVYSVQGQQYGNVGSALAAQDTFVSNLVQGKAGLVKQDGPNAPVTIAADNGGTSVNVAGTDGDRRVTGVADGVAPNDAATVNQVNNAISQGTSGQFARLDSRIDRVHRRANAGIASAMAMASLPQAYLPSRSMLSLGGATWNGESGYAIGLSTVSPNGAWVLKLSGATSSRGDYGGAVGVGYQW